MENGDARTNGKEEAFANGNRNGKGSMLVNGSMAKGTVKNDSVETERESDEGSRAGQGKRRPFFQVNASEFVSALGFGLFLAMLQLDFSNIVIFDPVPAGSSIPAAVAKVASVAGFCIASVLCWAFSDAITRLRSKRMCAVGSVVLAVVILLRCAIKVSGFDLWTLAVAADTVCGVMFAVVLVAWVADLWLLKRRAAVRVAFLSLCIAAAAVLLVRMIPTTASRSIVVAISMALSIFSNMVARSNYGVSEEVSRAASVKNVKFDMNTSVAIFVVALAYGLGAELCSGIGEIGFDVTSFAFLVAAMVISVSMFAIGERGVLLSTIFRWLSPLLAAALVVLSFASGIWSWVLTGIVLAICLACLMSLFITLVQLKLRFEVQSSYAVARVVVPWAWGSFAGMVATLFVNHAAVSAGDIVIDFLPLAIVVLLSFSTALAPYGLDMLTMPIEPDDDSEETEDESTTLHAWKSACDQIAKEGSLTPRETEVFRLLAKGRNAKVIERELFISVYTIKGHNNNIYRKLGVRSQQDLIDLVEDRRQELWKPATEIEQGGEHG